MFFNILCHFVLDYEGISMCILYLTIYVVNFAIPKDFPVLRHWLPSPGGDGDGDVGGDTEPGRPLLRLQEQLGHLGGHPRCACAPVSLELGATMGIELLDPLVDRGRGERAGRFGRERRGHMLGI